jgi:hypothetical protein
VHYFTSQCAFVTEGSTAVRPCVWSLWWPQDRPPGTLFRPHAIYNPVTQLYVLYWNYVHPNGQYAGNAAATSPTPQGPFKLQVCRERVGWWMRCVGGGRGRRRCMGGGVGAAEPSEPMGCLRHWLPPPPLPPRPRCLS